MDRGAALYFASHAPNVTDRSRARQRDVRLVRLGAVVAFAALVAMPARGPDARHRGRRARPHPDERLPHHRNVNNSDVPQFVLPPIRRTIPRRARRARRCASRGSPRSPWCRSSPAARSPASSTWTSSAASSPPPAAARFRCFGIRRAFAELTWSQVGAPRGTGVAADRGGQSVVPRQHRLPRLRGRRQPLALDSPGPR